MYRSIQRLLVEYKDARKGPTIILVQSPIGGHQFNQAIPALEDFPRVIIPHMERYTGYYYEFVASFPIYIRACTYFDLLNFAMCTAMFCCHSDNKYPVLDWQRVAAKKMIHQLLNTPSWLHVRGDVGRGGKW